MSRLLLVEDDADDVQLIRLGLESQGFAHEFSVAHDGAEALDLLLADYEASRPLPAVIVTDLKMPRMDGLELLGHLKGDARLRHIPVAVLTSSGYDADMEQATRLGAAAYLRKPADLNDYAEIGRRLSRLVEEG